MRTDFLGEPFEGSKYLLAWADVLGEIKTICHSGKKATMNARLDENGQSDLALQPRIQSFIKEDVDEEIEILV